MKTQLARSCIGFGLIVSASCATMAAPTGTTRDTINELSPGQRDAVLLSPTDVPEGRNCSISGLPLPSPATILDVEGYRAALDRALAGPVAGKVLLTVGADSAGALTRYRVLHASLSDSLATLLANTLDGHLRALTHDGRATGWHHRLLVTPDAGDDFVRVGQPVQCLPRIRNRFDIAMRMQNSLALHPGIATLPGRQRTTHVWVRVGRDGGVLETRIAKTSGRMDVDRIALDAASNAVFDPALLEGEPIELWVNLPLMVARQRNSNRPRGPPQES